MLPSLSSTRLCSSYSRIFSGSVIPPNSRKVFAASRVSRTHALGAAPQCAFGKSQRPSFVTIGLHIMMPRPISRAAIGARSTLSGSSSTIQIRSSCFSSFPPSRNRFFSPSRTGVTRSLHVQRRRLSGPIQTSGSNDRTGPFPSGSATSTSFHDSPLSALVARTL